MKIAVIGTGAVGQTIASKFISLGHDVMLGTRNVSEKLKSTARDAYGNPPFSEWYSLNSNIKLGTFADAAAFGEIVFNCTSGGGSVEALQLSGERNLNGKIIVDIANPLDFSNGMPPSLSIVNTNSLAEEIQKAFPASKVVKALNTIWCGIMINPAMVNGGDHNTFISGNDPESKEKVKEILKSFGWMDKNILDLGDISSARGTEMYLPLWLRIFGSTGTGAFNMKIVS